VGIGIRGQGVFHLLRGDAEKDVAAAGNIDPVKTFDFLIKTAGAAGPGFLLHNLQRTEGAAPGVIDHQ